jgi:hypothetical protein
MMKALVNVYTNIHIRMRVHIAKGLTTLTALGTPKKVETLPRQLHAV